MGSEFPNRCLDLAFTLPAASCWKETKNVGCPEAGTKQNLFAHLNLKCGADWEHTTGKRRVKTIAIEGLRVIYQTLFLMGV